VLLLPFHKGKWEEHKVICKDMRHILSFSHGIDVINDWGGKVLSILVLCIGGMICYEVLLRYAFNAPTIWAHELSLHVFACYSVLGGAYVLLNNGHVRMELLYMHLPPRRRAILDLVCFPLLLLFLGTIFVEGTKMALHSIEVREITVSFLHSPVYPVKTCIAVAAFLMLLQGLAQFIRSLVLAIKGRELK